MSYQDYIHKINSGELNINSLNCNLQMEIMKYAFEKANQQDNVDKAIFDKCRCENMNLNDNCLCHHCKYL